MKLWCLLENTACRGGVRPEHGLSLYLETGGKHILFDAGQTELFAENAKAMGVDLNSVDFGVLSHGHYDHGGGLSRFLAENDHAKFYVNQRAFEAHYNGTEKNIGLDLSLAANPRIVAVTEDMAPAAGMKICLCKDKTPVVPVSSFGLNVKRDGNFQPDDFCHEQYLLIQEQGRRILFSGCSHRGIENIMAWFRPDILVGGFHLKKLDPVLCRQQIQDLARRLLQYHTRYYTCHCTGKAQYEVMKEIMGDRLSYVSAGAELEI